MRFNWTCWIGLDGLSIDRSQETQLYTVDDASGENSSGDSNIQ